MLKRQRRETRYNEEEINSHLFNSGYKGDLQSDDADARNNFVGHKNIYLLRPTQNCDN